MSNPRRMRLSGFIDPDIIQDFVEQINATIEPLEMAIIGLESYEKHPEECAKVLDNVSKSLTEIALQIRKAI